MRHHITDMAMFCCERAGKVGGRSGFDCGHAESAAERWSIQLGAFRVETAAQQAARMAASLPVAKGKPVQIMQPSKAKDHLYHARLLNFTSQEAQSACAALHKKRIECSVVPPTAVKVANR